VYVLFGLIFCFGGIGAALTWFSTSEIYNAIGTLLPFTVTAACGFCYLGLTQETSVHEAMPNKRAALYTICAGVLCFGIMVFFLTYFIRQKTLLEAVATLIPFVLPSVAFGVFLILTETDRVKPWVLEFRTARENEIMNRFGDSNKEERFGYYSGAIWICAVSAFVVLSMNFGFRYSWLCIIAGVVGEMFLLAAFTKK
jgi:uncharacterized membrane protein YbhN (UPF0104 family)